MAKLSQVVRASRPAKFSTREHHRCQVCGRSGAFIRKFQLCRLCFRLRALKGEIPGVIKASW